LDSSCYSSGYRNRSTYTNILHSSASYYKVWL